MPILSEFCCKRCGRQMPKNTLNPEYCASCIAQYSPENWRMWSENRLVKPICLFCGKTITGRSVNTILAGRVKFCSAKCKQASESKIQEADWPEIVRLYGEKGMTAGNIAKLYGCTPTVILKVLRRFITPRVGAQSGAENFMFGRTHTTEARAKISAANIIQFSSLEARERHANLTAKQICEGRTGKAFNKLETAFSLLLDSIGAPYKWQAHIGKYVYDFLLHEPNMLVEVHGTFWHADPRFYDADNLRPTQARNVANDEQKEALAASKGFRFMKFWEHDIYTSPYLVKETLLLALSTPSNMAALPMKGST